MYETLTYKVPLQFEVFMQNRPTKAQVKEAHYKTGLSDREIMLIHGYALTRAIERMGDIKPVDQVRLDHEFYWLGSWKDDLTFDNYSDAINHLVAVCAYWAEWNITYPQEWMLEAEQVLYDRLNDFIYKGHRSQAESKNYNDIKQRIGDI